MREGGDTAPARLRAVDARHAEHAGQPVLHLRDARGLSDLTVVVPEVLAPLLVLIDGTRTAEGIRAAFEVRYGLRLGADIVARLIEALDEAFLLDNERARRAERDALRVWRSAESRPPSLADVTYPADRVELAAFLDGFLAGIGHAAHPPAVGAAADPLAIAPDRARRGARSARSDELRPVHRGIVSPHIDYARGGATYARVWRRAAGAARAADLVVLLGTDHRGRHGALTLTRQHYRTPYGVLPTATSVVDALAEAIGDGPAFAEELDHRFEHSVELSAVWLHHMRRGEPVDLVPVLCGSFAHFLDSGRDTVDDEPGAGDGDPPVRDGDRVTPGGGPGADPTIARFADTLRRVAGARRMLVVASADLSHIGPAFGGPPVDGEGADALAASDARLIAPVLLGDADGFFGAVAAIADRTNVCGTPPIYVLLRLLGGARGELVAYDRCPADADGTSLVSVCGVCLS